MGKENGKGSDNIPDTVEKSEIDGCDMCAQKLSPAEVWKNATKMINIKKREGERTRVEDDKRFDWSTLLVKLEERKQPSFDDPEMISSKIEDSLNFCDDFGDFSRSRSPKDPINPPSYFPKVELSVFGSFNIFKKLDLDTLFYIFYTEKNTLRQYFAAKILKSRSWRFHTRYNTWFQRLEEPNTITDDYEHGTYMFFDYDTSWSLRKKTDFTFEYKYLENTDM